MVLPPNIHTIQYKLQQVANVFIHKIVCHLLLKNTTLACITEDHHHLCMWNAVVIVQLT